MQLVYRKGYVIGFDALNHNPDFENYNLENIGTWLTTTGEQWLCTSEITDKEEFMADFFELTTLPKEQITIEERFYPFVLFYG